MRPTPHLSALLQRILCVLICIFFITNMFQPVLAEATEKKLEDMSEEEIKRQNELNKQCALEMFNIPFYEDVGMLRNTTYGILGDAEKIKNTYLNKGLHSQLASANYRFIRTVTQYSYDYPIDPDVCRKEYKNEHIEQSIGDNFGAVWYYQRTLSEHGIRVEVTKSERDAAAAEATAHPDSPEAQYEYMIAEGNYSAACAEKKTFVDTYEKPAAKAYRDGVETLCQAFAMAMLYSDMDTNCIADVLAKGEQSKHPTADDIFAYKCFFGVGFLEAAGGIACLAYLSYVQYTILSVSTVVLGSFQFGSESIMAISVKFGIAVPRVAESAVKAIVATNASPHPSPGLFATEMAHALGYGWLYYLGWALFVGGMFFMLYSAVNGLISYLNYCELVEKGKNQMV